MDEYLVFTWLKCLMPPGCCWWIEQKEKRQSLRPILSETNDSASVHDWVSALVGGVTQYYVRLIELLRPELPWMPIVAPSEKQSWGCLLKQKLQGNISSKSVYRPYFARRRESTVCKRVMWESCSDFRRISWKIKTLGFVPPVKAASVAFWPGRSAPSPRCPPLRLPCQKHKLWTSAIKLLGLN